MLLLVGQALAARAACCPPLDAAGPDVAAAGCCGHCPTTLAPTPEPASMAAKSASMPTPVLFGVAASSVVASVSTADRTVPSDSSPPAPAVSRVAPLRL
jgi:hypothetical protein